MRQRNVSLQGSDSPYLRNAVSSTEHSSALAEMATFENMADVFGQVHSPFVDDEDDDSVDD